MTQKNQQKTAEFWKSQDTHTAPALMKAKKPRGVKSDPVEQALSAQYTMGSGCDFDRRWIYLFGEITEDTAYRFLVTFRAMDSSPGPIKLIICSPGGAEASGYAIYDAIREARNRVEAIGYGAVQSVAAIIMQAAAIRRLTPSSTFLVHNGSLVFEHSDMNVDTLLRISKQVELSNAKQIEVFKARSKLSVADIEKVCLEDRDMSVEEAIVYGFIDSIYFGEGKK